jgi:hypothetical protein
VTVVDIFIRENRPERYNVRLTGCLSVWAGKAAGIVGRQTTLDGGERNGKGITATMSAIGALRQLEKEKSQDPSKGGIKVGKRCRRGGPEMLRTMAD